jgi:hypothetical protein
VTAVHDLGIEDATLDGELVVRRDGRSNIEARQAALSQRPPRPGLMYFAFDLLRAEGEDLKGAPRSKSAFNLTVPLQLFDRRADERADAVGGSRRHRRGWPLNARRSAPTCRTRGWHFAPLAFRAAGEAYREARVRSCEWELCDRRAASGRPPVHGPALRIGTRELH